MTPRGCRTFGGRAPPACPAALKSSAALRTTRRRRIGKRSTTDSTSIRIRRGRAGEEAFARLTTGSSIQRSPHAMQGAPSAYVAARRNGATNPYHIRNPEYLSAGFKFRNPSDINMACKLISESGEYSRLRLRPPRCTSRRRTACEPDLHPDDSQARSARFTFDSPSRSGRGVAAQPDKNAFQRIQVAEIH
jgi:hypothetical protein